MDVESTELSDAPGDGVSLESCLVKLQVGELIITESSSPRTGRDRKSVRVRVVGDCAFGWAEAAIIWVAILEVALG